VSAAGFTGRGRGLRVSRPRAPAPAVPPRTGGARLDAARHAGPAGVEHDGQRDAGAPLPRLRDAGHAAGRAQQHERLRGAAARQRAGRHERPGGRRACGVAGRLGSLEEDRRAACLVAGVVRGDRKVQRAAGRCARGRAAEARGARRREREQGGRVERDGGRLRGPLNPQAQHRPDRGWGGEMTGGRGRGWGGTVAGRGRRPPTGGGGGAATRGADGARPCEARRVRRPCMPLPRC
jgi:hypothetical protein